MRRHIFIIFLLFLLLFPSSKILAHTVRDAPADESQNYFCTLYFTYIGCPNCAYTDPKVLLNWTKRYPQLVVIEYMWIGGDFGDPNSRFFGEFCQKYRTPASVPKLVFDKTKIFGGSIDIPGAVNKIGEKNPCPLLEKPVYFENLDLNSLPAFPKIWANGRVLVRLGKNSWLFQWNGEEVSQKIRGKQIPDSGKLKELLFTSNIAKSLEGIDFEVVAPKFLKMGAVAFSKEELFSIWKKIDLSFSEKDYIPTAGFENAIKINVSENLITSKPEENQEPKEEISPKPEEETINLPFIGKIETKKVSLPVLTFLIAIADGFNPCAFFVLTFLLAALIGLSGARRKILLVGGIFVFFSGLFYFLFMSVLLNVFQLGEKVTLLTIIAGLIAIFAGTINIKDYFFFQKGISLTLPKSHKEKFIQRVKNLSLAKSTLALIVSTAVIASTVNIYELLCTFGFPMVYARILTLRELSSLEYYLYLFFYNLVYVIPLLFIILIFALTLGKKTFSQIWVRRLKLVSGFMILFLGLILMLKPKLLESALTAFSVLLFAIIISVIVILIDFIYSKKRRSQII